MQEITPDPSYTEVYGDEFERGPEYTNYRPDGSGDWLLIYTEDGSGRITTENADHPTQAGDILLYAPNAAQNYSTNPETGSWHLLWVHFQPRSHWHPWLLWPKIAPDTHWLHIQSETIRREIASALRRLQRAGRHTEPLMREIAMTALQEALLWAASTLPNGTQVDARIRKAVEIGSTEFRTTFVLPELAKRCGLSVSRFSHLFRQQIGQTPQRFWEEKRLSHAAHLLRLTVLPIHEIASGCGYDSPFYFTNRFRVRYGCSPREYRAQNRNQAGSR